MTVEVRILDDRGKVQDEDSLEFEDDAEAQAAYDEVCSFLNDMVEVEEEPTGGDGS